MKQRTQLQMFLHGGILLLIGGLLGFPFFTALTEGVGDNAVQFWRSAHSGILAAGVWVIAIGAIGHRLKVGARASSLLAWSTIVSSYAAVLAVALRAFWGSADSARILLHGLAYACYAALGVVGGVLSLLSVVLVIVGSKAALRLEREDR